MPKPFHPRPDEIPADLMAKASQFQRLALLVSTEARKTIGAFNRAGFTFPHELNLILTDIEDKTDTLQIYFRAENLTRRITQEGTTTEVNSQDRREETG